MNDDCCYKLYMHLNKTNGKVYVGQTKKSYRARWNDGKGYNSCSRFAKAIKKYGWNGFEHIALIEKLSKIDVDYFERFFISFFDSQNPEFGYNLTAGGDENPMDNPVVRAKHDESMKKLYADPEWQKKQREGAKKSSTNPEWRKKVCEANQKRSTNPEWRKKVCEANQKRSTNPEWLRKNREALKKMHADPEWQKKVCEASQKRSTNLEWRKKVCEANQKRSTDPEWQKKHHEVMKKVYADPEWQKKVCEANQKRCKKVLCVETKIVYGSLKEAAIAINLKYSNHISSCCNGKRKTAGGYHWEYVDEELKNKYVPYANKYKQVLCVETGVIYLSASCAASFVGVSRNKIYACCCGRQKTAGGYHWEYT